MQSGEWEEMEKLRGRRLPRGQGCPPTGLGHDKKVSRQATPLGQRQTPTSLKCASSASNLVHAQRRFGPQPALRDNPGAARPGRASGLAHAQRCLGPWPSRKCSARAQLLGPASAIAHARRRLGPKLGRGCRPRGCSSLAAAPRSSGSGGGEKWPAPGVSESCPLEAWRPLLTSCAVP